MNLDKKALSGFVKEVEDSRTRQKAETEYQREVFARARKQHFDVKAMRIVLQRRAMEPSLRDEQDYTVHAYELALGAKKDAIEDMERGATAREAARKHNLPRAAITALKAGAGNANIEPGEINGKEAADGHAERDGEEGAVGGQPVAEDAAGDAGGDGRRRHGEDDLREDGEGLRGEEQAELTTIPAAVVPAAPALQVSPGSPAAVDNPGGRHVAPPELINPSDTKNDDDAPAGALKAGSLAGGCHDPGRLLGGEEVARVAPPAPDLSDSAVITAMEESYQRLSAMKRERGMA